MEVPGMNTAIVFVDVPQHRRVCLLHRTFLPSDHPRRVTSVVTWRLRPQLLRIISGPTLARNLTGARTATLFAMLGATSEGTSEPSIQIKIAMLSFLHSDTHSTMI